MIPKILCTTFSERTSSPPATDPYWANVTALWKMDPWINSTSVADYSTSGTTLTLSGSAGFDTGQSKFHTGSYRGAISTTSRNWLQGSHASAFSFPGDFVVELWVYLVSDVGMNTQLIVDNRNDPGGSQNCWMLKITAGNPIWWWGSVDRVTSTGAAVTTSAWHHVAYARTFSNTTGRFYVDGNKVGEGTDATTFGNSAMWMGHIANPSGNGSPPGYNVWGYIQEFRITKGSNRGFTGDTIPVPTESFPTS